MKQLPEVENPVVLRTDFSDDAAWQSICEAIEEETAPAEKGFPSYYGGFKANVEFLSDPEYAGITPPQLLRLSKDYISTFIFLVDSLTFTHPERPILVVDLYAGSGRTFRVIPAQMYVVENNLSIANMDFEDFADAADLGDGIFRGFGED